MENTNFNRTHIFHYNQQACKRIATFSLQTSPPRLAPTALSKRTLECIAARRHFGQHMQAAHAGRQSSTPHSGCSAPRPAESAYAPTTATSMQSANGIREKMNLCSPPKLVAEITPETLTQRERKSTKIYNNPHSTSLIIFAPNLICYFSLSTHHPSPRATRRIKTRQMIAACAP